MSTNEDTPSSTGHEANASEDRLAMEIAVEMEVHAALGTTTASKAAAIRLILDQWTEKRVAKAFGEEATKE